MEKKESAQIVLYRFKSCEKQAPANFRLILEIRNDIFVSRWSIGQLILNLQYHFRFVSFLVLII